MGLKNEDLNYIEIEACGHASYSDQLFIIMSAGKKEFLKFSNICRTPISWLMQICFT